jgi:hypothetical protein
VFSGRGPLRLAGERVAIILNLKNIIHFKFLKENINKISY